MPSLTDFIRKVSAKDMPLGTGVAEKAKRTVGERTAYRSWIATDPENRSHISFEEWKSGDTDD